MDSQDPGIDQSRATALAAFRAEIGNIACIVEPRQLRAKSRDFHWYSPVLAAQLADCRAELVVQPCSVDEVLRIAAAIARHRLPLTVRGGGTGNYGQAVPLRGGVVLDMTLLGEVLEIGPGFARMHAGARLAVIEEAARATGQQLQMFPSTLRVATIGGFIAGGSLGIGSVRHGILRESRSLRSVTIATVEEQPRLVVLKGADIEKVHHAWGTNGIMVEVELGLVPAEEWLDCIALFPSYADVLRFGSAVMETNIDVFLLSAVERRFAPFYQRLEAYFDGTRDGMFAMVKRADVDRFFALAEQMGGTRSLAMTAAEIGANNLLRIPECAFNHTTLRALKVDSSWTYLQLVMPAPLEPELVARQMARYGDEVLMHHEFARFGGKPRISALPLIRYTEAARLDRIARELEADGCTVFNAHVYVLEDTGRKEIDARQVAFKRDADPHGLMNPGKSRTLAA